jgi:protoporphyrinogen oxidase
MSKPIVILGGGATGLAAAYYFWERKIDFILIEKSDYLGGLSATRKYKNLLYEFGPHAFHLKNPALISWLKKLLGRDFRIIATNTQVFINNQLFNYPLNASELMRKIKPQLAIKIIGEYLFVYFKNIFRKPKIASFEDWGINNFGQTLYRLSFGDYTKKVWGISPKKLSATLATNKLNRLALSDILLKLIGFRGKNQPAYFKKYLYPISGAGVIFDKMIQKIKDPKKILQSCKITSLKIKDNQIESIDYQNQKGEIVNQKCTAIISTLSLKDLIRLINTRSDKEKKENNVDLNYRGLIIIYLIILDQKLPTAQWIYLVENKFQCNRVTIQKNLSPKFKTNGKTILAFELSASKGDKLWQEKDETLKKIAEEDLKKLNFGDIKILDFFIYRIENAYPIYELGYEKELQKITK